MTLRRPLAGLALAALALITCLGLADPTTARALDAAAQATPVTAPAVTPVATTPHRLATKRTYYQEARTPGYSVYCRWDPELLLADHNRGSGCFDSSGDYFAVVDEKSDGRGVAVLWTMGDRRGICRNKLGAKDRPAWPTCQADSVIPENKKLTAWVSSCNVTATVTCRKWGDYPQQKKALKRTYRTTHPADG